MRIYCDATGIPDPKKHGERMKKRKDMGFTWFRMDIRYGTIGNTPGAFDAHGILTDKGLAFAGELVTGVPKPFIEKGYITVPDTPGLGLELNEPVIKEHLRVPGYFEPTKEWDNWQPRTRGPFPHFNPEGQWVNETESYTQ